MGSYKYGQRYKGHCPPRPGVELTTGYFPSATTTNFANEKLAISGCGWPITYLRSEFHHTPATGVRVHTCKVDRDKSNITLIATRDISLGFLTPQTHVSCPTQLNTHSHTCYGVLNVVLEVIAITSERHSPRGCVCVCVCGL